MSAQQRLGRIIIGPTRRRPIRTGTTLVLGEIGARNEGVCESLDRGLVISITKAAAAENVDEMPTNFRGEGTEENSICKSLGGVTNALWVERSKSIWKLAYVNHLCDVV